MKLPKSTVGHSIRISTSVSIEGYKLAKKKGIKWSDALSAGIWQLAGEFDDPTQEGLIKEVRILKEEITKLKEKDDG